MSKLVHILLDENGNLRISTHKDLNSLKERVSRCRINSIIGDDSKVKSFIVKLNSEQQIIIEGE